LAIFFQNTVKQARGFYPPSFIKYGILPEDISVQQNKFWVLPTYVFLFCSAFFRLKSSGDNDEKKSKLQGWYSQNLRTTYDNFLASYHKEGDYVFIGYVFVVNAPLSQDVFRIIRLV
jgi:hypothetical protein